MSSETLAVSQAATAAPVEARSAGKSAGALLRQARETHGMTLEALAALLKVPVRKLEALEEDRHADLQGPTFVRALAQAACRAVKTDAAPVLALLPHAQDDTLDHVSTGINKAFKDPAYARDWRVMLHEQRGLLVLTLVFALGALTLWLLPEGWVEQARGKFGGEVSASAASGVEEPPLPVPAPSAEPIAGERLPPLAASAASGVPLATPLAPLAVLPRAPGAIAAPAAGTRPVSPALAASGVGTVTAAPRTAWAASGVRPVVRRPAGSAVAPGVVSPGNAVGSVSPAQSGGSGVGSAAVLGGASGGIAGAGGATQGSAPAQPAVTASGASGM